MTRGPFALLALLCLPEVALALPANGRGACADGIRFSDPRTGEALMDVDLTPTGGAFELTYFHSVHETLVRSRYVAEPAGIRQLSESFTTPGYGMGAVPASDGRIPEIQSTAEGLTVALDRLFRDVVLRLHEDHRNRLEAAGRIELAETLGNRAVRLSAVCLSAEGPVR